MTKEQEEAIKYFNNFTKYTRQLAKDEEKVNGKTIYQKDLEKRANYFKTVLNMLKEKDRETNTLLWTIQGLRGLANVIDIKQKEIEKKDKIIDLMAEEINNNFCNTCPYIDYDYDLNCKNSCKDNFKECWKLYFERKVEKE